MLYVLPKCEDSRCGLGYPDFIERGTSPYSSSNGSNGSNGNGDTSVGKVYKTQSHADAAWSIMLSETDKEVSRTHTLNMSILHGLWTQSRIKSVAAKGIALQWRNPTNPTSRATTQSSATPLQLPAPHFGNLSTGLGFAIEVGFWSEPAAEAQPTILFDCRGNATAVAAARSRRGVALVQSGSKLGVVNISLTDSVGNHQTWDTDRESLLRGEGSSSSSSSPQRVGALSPSSATPTKMVANHVVFTVDGASRTIMSVVNGKLSDGGEWV